MISVVQCLPSIKYRFDMRLNTTWRLPLGWPIANHGGQKLANRKLGFPKKNLNKETPSYRQIGVTTL